VVVGPLVVGPLVVGPLVLAGLVSAMPRRRAALGPRAKTALISAALGVAAAGLTLSSLGTDIGGLVSSRPTVLVALTVTFFLAEQFLVNIEFRRETHSMTFAGVPLAAGILLLPVHELVLARLVGSLAALLIQRIGAEKTAYNTCAFVFEAALSATLVQAVLGVPVRLDVASISFALVCIAAVDQAMSSLVLLVIRIHGVRMERSEAVGVLIQAVALSIVASTFAAAICLLTGQGPSGDILVVALLAVSIVLYRGYATITRRHQSLAMVHDFVADNAGADSVDDLARQSLARVRTLLRCTTAELLLTAGPSAGQADGPQLLKRIVCADESVEVSHVPTDSSDWVRSKALHHGEPTLAPRAGKDPATQKWLAAHGARDALVVPLLTANQPVGVITVLDRLGETTSFTEDDLALLQTLSTHLSVSLHSTLLLDKLAHDATHDSLTGLANRAHLSARIAEAYAASPDDVAVLLLDLNKFKEVNDVLGHDVGDRLLQVVAERLRTCLPGSATIARLGGDEFAVLLVGLGSDATAAATRLARRAHEELGRPVRLDEALLAPEASVGVAVGRQTRADDLLRCADTAMYAAKHEGSAVAVHHSDMDRGRAERLALVADLRVALEEHPEQFGVVYQPKIDLVTGEAVSAEALVRWNHPTLGTVTPDRFIPLAETSGVIDALTGHVLAQALAACRSWHEHGIDLSVAVNLSARNVMNPELPALVGRALQRFAVAPEKLILEITESVVMEEPDRAVPVLHALSERGITISLDDFGTGYSSLSYLQQLPVSELKIDRSFVSGLLGERSANASALIRSITALGESLNLSIVAEGIETDAQRAAVAELGCHVGQGYLISRPLPDHGVIAWFAEHTPARLRLAPAI
jgi:diguanylate cyclase (GGDEF)-like protein